MTTLPCGCIGEHLTHSFSKEIHALLADYQYDLIELSPEAVVPFIKAKSFHAVNVTIPYKETVMPALDHISDEAAAIGAVNTVVNMDGKLYGHNTDFFGMRSLFSSHHISISGKKVLILGTGGTCKTACAVVKSLGAASVYKVSRTAKDGCITYEEAYARHSDAGIIINTTPCGMYPNPDAAPIDLSRFPALSGVADAIYNPLRTRLISSAMARGIPAAPGLYMLVAQGVRASEYFLGHVKSDAETAATVGLIYRRILAQKENIVLIGMPGCGKSSVGKALSKALGKPFFDTDEAFTARIGVSPGDYIKAHGEAAFREEEAATVAALAKESGRIIATGGGAVLREENLLRLRQNGTLLFLDRPLELLVTTADRPLSSDRDKLAALYAARLPIYRAAADLIVDGSGCVQDVTAAILEKIEVTP